MKKFFSLLLIALSVTLSACTTSCGTLQSGGAYAPTATNEVTGAVAPTQAPDYAFFACDNAFDLAFSTISATFKFERENRDALWKISPEIKHAMDKARPVAFKLGQDYAKARTAYQANPTPAGLSELQTALSRAESIAAAIAVQINTTPAKK